MFKVNNNETKTLSFDFNLAVFVVNLSVMGTLRDRHKSFLMISRGLEVKRRNLDTISMYSV